MFSEQTKVAELEKKVARLERESARQRTYSEDSCISQTPSFDTVLLPAIPSENGSLLLKTEQYLTSTVDTSKTGPQTLRRWETGSESTFSFSEDSRSSPIVHVNDRMSPFADQN